MVKDFIDTVHPAIVSELYGVQHTQSYQVNPTFELRVSSNTSKRTFNVTTKNNGNHDMLLLMMNGVTI
jgi:hypothetical protein